MGRPPLHGRSAVPGVQALSRGAAESVARNEHRTLPVDAELRKPVIGREYGLDAQTTPPLRRWLEDPVAPGEPTRVALGTATSLDVIPWFEAAPSPTELLSHGFLGALEQWREEYDVIVIDSAPACRLRTR